jgi:uncharacterized protein (UPF0332 family)
MSPGENSELVAYRFQRAKEALAEAEVQLQNEFWNLAVNRLYYACFYAVSSLLASKEIYIKTHAGAKTMFGLHFVKPGIIHEEQGDFYARVFGMRQSGDYEDFCDYEQEDVVDLVKPAKELVNTIESILFKQ